MAKRIKVQEPKKDYSSFARIGAIARDEGQPLDSVECKLLRVPEMASAWRDGWRGRDEELKLRRKRA